MKYSKKDFADLISQHQGIIHKVCRLYAHEVEDRRDLFQDIVLQLWRSIAAYEGKASISTWMYRVALNTAISSLRKKNRLPLTQSIKKETHVPFEVESLQEQQEKRQWLYAAINHLSAVERGIILLHLEDHSYDEIGAIIGISRNHVGVKLNRIKQKLKKILIPYFE